MSTISKKVLRRKRKLLLKRIRADFNERFDNFDKWFKPAYLQMPIYMPIPELKLDHERPRFLSLGFSVDLPEMKGVVSNIHVPPLIEDHEKVILREGLIDIVDKTKLDLAIDKVIEVTRDQVAKAFAIPEKFLFGDRTEKFVTKKDEEL